MKKNIFGKNVVTIGLRSADEIFFYLRIVPKVYLCLFGRN